jgi:hypothetical protein
MAENANIVARSDDLNQVVDYGDKCQIRAFIRHKRRFTED